MLTMAALLVDTGKLPLLALQSLHERSKVVHLSVLDFIYQKAGMVRNTAPVSVLRDGIRSELRFEEIQRKALHLSNYLINSGIESGDRIATLCEPNAEFGIVFFATIRAGAILVPLDVNLTKDDLCAQFADSSPRMIFTTLKYFDLAASLMSDADAKQVILIDEPNHSSDRLTVKSVSSQMLKVGRERDLEEAAVIAYTAGTNGAPKGVVLTFANLLFQSDRLCQITEVGKNDVWLSDLPSAQVLDLTLGYLGVLFSGGQAFYLPNAAFKQKVRALKDHKVHTVLTTPVFLERLKRLIEHRVNHSSMQTKLKFKMCFGLSKLLPRWSRRRLFPVVLDILGPQFRTFISFGAPLSREVARFLDVVGVDVCQGYGLTEASCFVTSNSQDNFRLNSVGKPSAEVEVRLIGSKGVGDQGEVVTRGAHVMQGYYRREDKTNVAVDNSGWLYTGDLGSFDEDGFLYINGRITDLILLKDGRKFYPQEVEAVLSTSPFVKEVCVVGVRQPDSFHGEEVVAVVVPEGKQTRISQISKSFNALAEQLPAFHKPNRIVVSSEPLPRTQFGEVKRLRVAAWLSSHESAPR